MKVYIASSSNFTDQCEVISDVLKEEFGYETTRKWWKHYIKNEDKFKKMTDAEYYAHPEARFVAELDFMAIDEADIVIIYLEDYYKLTGAMIEMGYAFKAGKPVFVVGKMKRSSMTTRCIHVDTPEELINTIRRFVIE